MESFVHTQYGSMSDAFMACKMAGLLTAENEAKLAEMFMKRYDGQEIKEDDYKVSSNLVKMSNCRCHALD